MFNFFMKNNANKEQIEALRKERSRYVMTANQFKIAASIAKQKGEDDIVDQLKTLYRWYIDAIVDIDFRIEELKN